MKKFGYLNKRKLNFNSQTSHCDFISLWRYVDSLVTPVMRRKIVFLIFKTLCCQVVKKETTTLNSREFIRIKFKKIAICLQMNCTRTFIVTSKQRIPKVVVLAIIHMKSENKRAYIYNRPALRHIKI